MQLRRNWPAFFVLWLLACSSSPKYAYYPETAGVYQAGGPGATYSLPPNDNGSVQVLALGPVDVSSSHIRTMHLRMVINNQTSAQTWILKTKEQMFSIPREGSSQPAYVDTGGKLIDPSEVTIPPESKRVVDLYFALPKSLADSAEIPKFSLQWNLLTPVQSVARVTTFDRSPMPTQVARVEPGASWTAVA